ncbi:hypothetical protein [Pseudoxanthomonas mexicana]
MSPPTRRTSSCGRWRTRSRRAGGRFPVSVSSRTTHSARTRHGLVRCGRRRGLAAKGLLAGDVELGDNTLLRLATELEGHPDDVAPALFGGLTIAWMDEGGPQHKNFLVHRGVSPLVFVPTSRSRRRWRRGLAPLQVTREDAVFNVSRSALLIAALTQSPELLLAATEDKLHQSYRAQAMPATDQLVRALRAHGLRRRRLRRRAERARAGRRTGQRLAAASTAAGHRPRGSRSCWPSTSRVVP